MKLYRIIHKEDGYKEKIYVTAEDYPDISAMVERRGMDVQKIELLTEDVVDCNEDLTRRKPAFMLTEAERQEQGKERAELVQDDTGRKVH